MKSIQELFLDKFNASCIKISPLPHLDIIDFRFVVSLDDLNDFVSNIVARVPEHMLHIDMSKQENSVDIFARFPIKYFKFQNNKMEEKS